jgi:hypothetical protein
MLPRSKIPKRTDWLFGAGEAPMTLPWLFQNYTWVLRQTVPRCTLVAADDSHIVEKKDAVVEARIPGNE